MDTLYYRKIAEIVRRDVADAEMRAIAERALNTPRDRKARLAKADKRALKSWMHAWCDAAEAGERRGDG